jgi:hypothetical protein
MRFDLGQRGLSLRLHFWRHVLERLHDVGELRRVKTPKRVGDLRVRRRPVDRRMGV